MPENTTAYRHLLVPAKDGPALEWLRIQTGCRSLTKTLSLLIQIATTVEGLDFIQNHPRSPISPGPWPPTPKAPGAAKGRSVRDLMLGKGGARHAEEQPFTDAETVAIAIAARNIKDEN